MNCLLEILVLRIFASPAAMVAISGIWLAFATHFMVSSVLYRKWGFNCACIMAIWEAFSSFCFSTLSCTLCSSSLAMILKFRDICPNSSSLSEAILTLRSPSCRVRMAVFIRSMGFVIFRPTRDATITHSNTLMVSITVSTRYMELRTSLENTLGHAITVYRPLSPKGWINNSPAR